MQAIRLSDNVREAVEIIETEAGYLDHSLTGLEAGLIPFSTQAQVGFVAGLLHKAGCPEEWRLLATGILLGRNLRSSKDTSMAEMSALISWLLGGHEDTKEPCEETRKVLSDLLASILGAAALVVPETHNGTQ